MQKNYVLNVWSAQENVDDEELTDIVLECLCDFLGVNDTYPADDPEDTGLYFNAAGPDGDEYGALSVGSFGMWIDDSEYGEGEVIDTFINEVPTVCDDIVHVDYTIE